ncbi:MAG: proline dehydrogenase family protein [Candidatus Kapaibacterium sp.]
MLNQMIIKLLPIVPKPLVHVFAKKYIAGDTLEDAVRVTKEFEQKGGMTTIDVLGEFVTNRERALHEKSLSSKVIDAIHEFKLPTYLSVKPTSLGLGIDTQFGYENIRELVEKANNLGIWVRLDMENSPYTTKTLDLYKKLRAEGFDKIGTVIQAYMKRSMDDVKSLIELKPSLRLCKGIYNESPEIAYKDPDRIRQNYKQLLDLMLDNGMYVGIATHDEELIKYGMDQVTRRKLDRNDYEFQMLLGVREERRDDILAAGHRLRIYVPFGEDWYGYSTRRLKENPEMAGHIFKSIFKGGK